MSEQETKRRKGEFDDALKGYYQDHDEVLPDENTDYKSLTAESVGSLILGFLSALTFVSMLFVIFPIMGIVLGVTAIRKILRATQELEGLGVASAGVGLSAILAIAGMTYQIYLAQYEVPLGYEVITFSDLLADSKTGRIPEYITRSEEFVLNLTPHLDTQGDAFYYLDTQGKTQKVQSEAQVFFYWDAQGNAQEARVFIEGFMYPTPHATEIKSFMLVPSVERGQFGTILRNPSQMIDVTLVGDLRATYRTSPVKVGGTLTVNPNRAPGTTPYSLKASIFR